MNDLDKYLDFAKKCAEDAGTIMKRYFRADDIGTTWKKDTTPLTIADTLINDNIIASVMNEFPTHGVLGEEKSYKPDRSLIWVIDPVDGTVPFSIGIPIATFSLALVDRTDGQPIVGVVYDPYLDRLYWSIKGRGAFLNDAKIRTSDKKTLQGSYLSILGFKWGKLGSTIDELYRHKAICLSMVSQAYSATLVASGELVSSIFGYGSPWDSAAAGLIVKEAGGEVTDLFGATRRFDEFSAGCVLSANQKIHNQIIAIIKNASGSIEEDWE